MVYSAFALIAVLGLVAALAGPASAVSAGTFRATDEISARTSPTAASTPLVGPHRGQVITVECQILGEPAGPKGNTLYFQTTWPVNGAPTRIYVPDTWTDSPHLAGQPPIPGIPMCTSGITVASAATPPTVLNGHNIGAAQNGQHQWGSCAVQDFKGGEFDWTIVSFGPSTRIIHNGMLWGWFDAGGAPGRLGCPTSDEYSYLGFAVRQDFEHGSLYWTPGMNRAADLDLRHDRLLHAVSWARGYLGSNYQDQQCLTFVTQAYNQAGIALDWAGSAKQWAINHRSQLNTTGTPPVGALVFWTSGIDGHVAISLGNGTTVSTSDRTGQGVHIMSVADRNSTDQANYGGWYLAS